jgi:amidase
MKTNSLIYRSALELAGLMCRGEVSAEEVVKAHLERLREVNPMLNAVIQIAPESAIEQAREADAAVRAGEPTGELHGVPFTVKDVYPVKDVARLEKMTEMAELLELPRDRDATAVSRLRAAGAILIGVTRATWWKDREDRYGPVHNPYDLATSASGSSGGEGAVIAAGGSALGLGSDSGGSLRQPATKCGIATIRPSNGRVPRAADSRGTFDTRTVAGPMARTIGDVAAALKIISGPDPLDPATLPVPLGDWREQNMKGKRVGVFLGSGAWSVDGAMVLAVEFAAGALRDAGAVVMDAQPPDVAGGWAITQEYWRGYPEGNGAGEAYEAFLIRWDNFRVAMALFMKQFDLLVCPADPTVYTALFSLVGWPAAVVRAGTDGGGMPMGVQIVANAWRDDVALAGAACVEAASGGFKEPQGLGRK